VDRPFLLIDVDGVLVPFGGDQPPAGHRLHRLSPDIEVWLNPVHGEWLNGLAKWFELVWATAWEHRAAMLIAPVLGLPALPVIEFGSAPMTNTWKLADVRRYVGDRPVAWIDDDLGSDAFDWAEQRMFPTLLVATASQVGFDEDHLAVLEEFGRTMREDDR
jgi:hypothetical protein